MTDSRVSRGLVQVLVQPAPDARVSRGLVQALVRPTPDARVSRGLVQVLTFAPPPVPDTVDPAVATLAPSMWLSARQAALAAQADGSTVAAWADLQGAATGVSQGTAGNRPVYRWGRTPNGGPSVDFSSTKYMTGTDSRSDTAQTVIAVVRRTTTASNRTIVGASGDGGLQVRLGSAHKVEMNKQNVVAIASTAPGVVPDAWSIVVARVTTGAGGSWTTRINRAADGSGSTTQALTAARTTMLGVGPTSTEYWNGEMAEVLTFPRALSDAEIVTVEDYLYDKWFAEAPTGPTIVWWDGDSREDATVLGWWDGSAVQPLTVQGYWDGAAIQPLN